MLSWAGPPNRQGQGWGAHREALPRAAGLALSIPARRGLGVEYRTCRFLRVPFRFWQLLMRKTCPGGGWRPKMAAAPLRVRAAPQARGAAEAPAVPAVPLTACFFVIKDVNKFFIVHKGYKKCMEIQT